MPGAAGVVDWLVREGVPHRYLTNTTSRPRRAIVEKLAGWGSRPLRTRSSPRRWRRWPGCGARHRAARRVRPEATATEFAGLDPLPDGAESGAGAVVVGDLGRGWDFATLNRAFRLLMSDAAPPLVALGLTRYWRAEDGLRLDAGPFVRALEYATGRVRSSSASPIRRSTRARSRTSASSRARWSWSATTCAPTSRVPSEPD